TASIVGTAVDPYMVKERENARTQTPSYRTPKTVEIHDNFTRRVSELHHMQRQRQSRRTPTGPIEVVSRWSQITLGFDTDKVPLKPLVIHDSRVTKRARTGYLPLRSIRIQFNQSCAVAEIVARKRHRALDL